MSLVREQILFVALVGATLGLPVSALGCSCAQFTPPEAYSKADYVAQGVVVSKMEPGPTPRVVRGDTMMLYSSSDMVRYEFRISHIWKGLIESEMVIYSARDGAFCGYVFEVGEEYLVYGHFEDDPDHPDNHRILGVWAGQPDFPARCVGLCLTTKRASRAEYDKVFLGPPSWTAKQIEEDERD